MARTDTLKNFLVDIADKLRAYLGIADVISHADYDTKIDDVYEAGKQAERDALWDALQQKGDRTNYASLFSYGGWNGKTFKPKYSMQPTNAMQMFYYFNKHEEGNDSVDLVELLNDAGVTLDFSKATSINYCFQDAKITHIGIVDFSSIVNANAVFYHTYWLNKIDKIIVNENNVFDSNCFSNCKAYDINFEGVIACDISLNYPSNLSKATIESVINHFSTTATGKTFSLKSEAVTGAFGSTDSPEWLDLIATKPNLTISLV